MMSQVMVLYAQVLRKEQQSFFRNCAGILQSFTAYWKRLNVLLAGYLEHRFGNNQSKRSYTMIFVCL
jgi:PAT family beta-lactamase induction signal transducer AmpG